MPLPKNLSKEDRAYIKLIDLLHPEGERIATSLGADPTRDGLLATYCLATWVLKQQEQEHNKQGRIALFFNRNNQNEINETLLKNLREKTETFMQTGYTEEQKENHYPRNLQLAVHELTVQSKYFKSPKPLIVLPSKEITDKWKQRWSKTLKQAA